MTPRTHVLMLLTLLNWEALVCAEQRPVLVPFERDGRILGFRVLSQRVRLAEVTLGSAGNIWARHASATPDSSPQLKLSSIASNCGLEFAADSSVEVAWDQASGRYEVRWRLTVNKFSRDAWQKAVGRVPVHWLCISLPNAGLLHLGGWHIPTPGLDPYPLHNQASGYGRQITSRWSDDWTIAPPVSALPLATLGLWAPATRHYVAFDFHSWRLTDPQAQNVGVAGAWHSGKPFVTLVWPPASPYGTMRYPDVGQPFTLAGCCHLVLSSSLGSDDDPNRLAHQFVWDKLRSRMPAVSPSLDLSWVPESRRIDSFPQPEWQGLCTRVQEPQWFRSGATAYRLGPFVPAGLDRAFRSDDAARIGAIRDEVTRLLRHVRRYRLGGQECCSWRGPLEGEHVEMFGPGAASHHTDAAWRSGLLLLLVAMNDPGSRERLLPIVDGVVRFTQHMGYTRGSQPDAPACQSTLAVRAGVHFCLRYCHAFRHDPERNALAALTLRLARTLAYRYLTVWPCDNDHADRVDSAFLLQPRGGRSWLGTASGAGALSVLPALVEVYVATGDPVLGQYVRGMVERMPQLLDAHSGRAVSIALAHGAAIKRGSYYAETTEGDFEALAWPISSARSRVVAGRGGAIVFNRGKLSTSIAAYRCTDQGFSFRVVSDSGQPAPRAFDLAITFPHVDLRGRAITLIRGGKPQRLEPAAGYATFDSRPDTVYVRDIRGRDEVAVGGYSPDAPVIACAPLKPRTGPPRSPAQSLTALLRAPTPAVPRLRTLEPLFRKFSGQIAVLPDPRTPDLRTSGVAAMLDRHQLAGHLRFLTPQEMVDPSVFCSKNVAVALYLGSPWYWQTVSSAGDGDRAILSFLNTGGLLLVMPSGPWPFYYRQDNKAVASAHTFGLAVCGRAPWPTGSHANGVAQNGWERPPKDRVLTFHVEPKQSVIASVPMQFAFPTPGEADQRWRPSVHKCPKGAVYTPLITLRDETGRSYCEGAALTEFRGEELKGARVLRVWCSLPALQEIGEAIVGDVFRYALSTSTPRATAVATNAVNIPFSDDFASYKDGADGRPRWRTTAGRWRVDSAALVGEDCPCQGYGAAGVFCGGDRWEDYAFSVRFKVESSSSDWKDGPWFGVRCDDLGDGYHINFTKRDVQLHKISYGISTNEHRPIARADWVYDDKWHTLELRVEANRICATVDNKRLFEARDDMILQLPSLRSGGIALSARRWQRSRGRMTVRFDDVKVTPIP